MVILRSLQSTDEMLVHLQSFSSNPSYYTIPESAKNGVPLFYLPPNSNNPVSVVKDYFASEYTKDRLFKMRKKIWRHNWSSQLWAGKLSSTVNGIRTHDFCDTGAVLYHLSYQVNWGLVTLWVRNTPIDGFSPAYRQTSLRVLSLIHKCKCYIVVWECNHKLTFSFQVLSLQHGRYGPSFSLFKIHKYKT